MATIAKLVVSLNLDDKAFKKGISAVPKMVQEAQKSAAAAAEKTVKATQKAEAGIKKAQVAAQQAAVKISDPLSAAADGFAKLGNNFNAKSIEVPKGGFITALRDIERQYKTTQAAAQKTVTANAAAGKSFAAIKDPISQAAQSFSQIGNVLGKSGGGIKGAISSIATTIKSGLSSAFSSVGPLAAKAGTAIKAGLGIAVTAVGAAVGVITAGAAAIGGAFIAITAGAFSLAKSAAPVQGIRTAFAGLASTVEGGSQAMLAALQKASMGMVTNTDLMRQFNLASQLVGTEFAQALPQAFTYLGKVASATGQDMGFLMNSLTVGIGRLSPMILDNLGVQVDLTQAYADFADANGLVAGSLTKTQQQAALTAQVMQKLEQNTANIPTTFGSAAQVFGAFGAELQNIREDVGMDLLPTFTSLFQTFQKFLPAIRAIGQGFAGTFAAIVNVAKSFVKGLLSSMGIDFDSLANNAGSWGENIVMQLASGMARAIGAVLSVLNSLGQAIAGWLAPGSPPKLLPELPAWGENAANWFLRGMTNANMNILRDLSGQVEAVMRSIMPEASTQDLAKAILEVRTNMEKALSGGGDLLSTLPKELRGYAQAMLQAEAASKKLKAANEFLVKTQEKYNNLLKPINAELEAISRRQQEVANDMRKAELDAMEARARAEGDSLALELIALERRQMELEGQKTAVEDEAKTAIDAAGEKVSAAQAEQDAAQKRLDLEQQLIQHQIETNNLLADTIKKLEETKEAAGGAAGGAGAGGVGGLASALENLNGAGGGFSNIGSSISKLAQQIQKEFAPTSDAANNLGKTWGKVIDGIKGKIKEWTDSLRESKVVEWLTEARDYWVDTAWPAISTAVTTAWDIISPHLNNIKTWLETNIPIALEAMRSAWVDVVWPAIQAAASNTWATTKSTFESIKSWLETTIPTALETLKSAWADTVYPALQTAVENFSSAITPIWDSIVGFWQNELLPALESVRAAWVDTVWPALQSVIEGVWAIVSVIFTEIKDWLETNIPTALAILKGLWTETVWPAIQTAVETVWGIIRPIFTSIKEWLDDKIPVAIEAGKSAFSTAWGVIESAVSTAWGVIEPIFTAIENFGEWLKTAAFAINLDLPDIPEEWIPGSPIPLHTAWKGFSRFLKTDPFNTTSNLSNIGISGAAAGAVMGGSFGVDTDRASSPSVTVQVSGNNINNGMDLATFNAQVKKAVVSGLRNRT